MRRTLTVCLDNALLSEYDDNGFLGIQIDAYGEDKSGVGALEAINVLGLYSRPLDPQQDDSGDTGFASYTVTLWEGNDALAVPFSDPRSIPGFPQLQKGETIIYASAFNFVRLHADGRISTMCTTDGTANGEVIAFEVGPNGFALRGPWGKLTHDGLGLHFLHISGARLDLGAIAGLPAPLDAVQSYAQIKAHTVAVAGTAVTVGTGDFDPAAKATPTLEVFTAEQAAIAALQATVNALAAAVTAITAIPLNSAAAPAAAAAVAAAAASASAVSASGTAVGTGTVTIPARSAQVA